MNIKDKLKRLDPSSKEKDELQSSKQNQNKIISVLGGKLKENQEGVFFKKKEKYQLQYKHGLHSLEGIKNYEKEQFKYIFNYKKGFENRLDYRNFLFIDTETTGLAGGTGTVPFMVGLGYFTEENFIVEQLFMRDFDEEAALLEALKQMIKSYPIIVSFNGKSFDLPLIKTRLVMNRCREINYKCHLDLLHASRRVWSHLESCSLTSLEENILNITREDYLPGSEVPGLYFDYLNNNHPRALVPVFRHNLIDIVSLVTLINHLSLVHDHKSSFDLNERELFNLGKLYEKEKKMEKSINFYEKALDKTDSIYLKTKINKKLSWQYKREKKWKQALKIWNKMAENKRGGIFPYVEMAKYYEHQTREYKKAINCTKKAAAFLKEKRRIKTNYEEKKEELEHRLNRLKRKIN
uniref:YprB ribonuclease H-like domain-containing protein n=1 Tax=uncultured organism TaxID=155900 RepID=M1Q2A9_9ZZZZ|nr:hypothetical protein FLSS-24_0018 [uncultured organism]